MAEDLWSPAGAERRLPPDPGMSDLRVTFHRITPTVLVCSVVGEVDLLSAPYLHGALAAESYDAPVILVIDLTQVPFLSLAGVRVLVDAVGNDDPRVPLRLVASRQVARAVEVSGFASWFVVHGSLAEALAADAAYRDADAAGVNDIA